MNAPVRVLMYHAVGDGLEPGVHRLSVSPDAFARQMELLGERGFTPVGTARLGEAWRGGAPLPPRPVLVTFDDGCAGVHRHALPVLARHGFPATVFVSTGRLRGRHDTGRAPSAVLDWRQVREPAAAGVEIGGHSHTHSQLDQLGEAALTAETTRCRDIIGREVGAEPASFAYPFGYADRRVRGAVRVAGFAQAPAVRNALARRTRGPYAPARLTVRRSAGPEELVRVVEGRSVGRRTPSTGP